MAHLKHNFFACPTLTVSRELIGQRLVRIDKDGAKLAGIVVEAEAYIGTTDMACHARAGRTRRTEVMFGPAGIAYVYLTYGIHWMLNIVTEKDGFPAAVLLRAIFPTQGEDTMRARRGPGKPVADGPAKLTQALNIDGAWNGYDMCQPTAQLFVEEGNSDRTAIKSSPRVGLGKTPEPWLSLPWNYRLLN